MELSNLTFEQLRLVIVVYSASIIPLISISYLTYKNKIPKWIFKLYILMFLICAFGWELWFTYGWVDGACVNLRRADILSYYIPIDINWLLNSLGDAGAICLGGLFITHKIYKNDNLNFIISSFLEKIFFGIGKNRIRIYTNKHVQYINEKFDLYIDTQNIDKDDRNHN